MNNYFWYSFILIWAGIILGLLSFATMGTGYILPSVVLGARIISQILGVVSLFAVGVFFYWMSGKKAGMERFF